MSLIGNLLRFYSRFVMDGETVVCKLVDPPLACSINLACALNMCQGVVVSIYIIDFENKTLPTLAPRTPT